MSLSTPSAPIVFDWELTPACARDCSLENSSSSQHRKSGPDEDDAATIAAREFLLGSDMAVQALANSDEDATGVSSAGAQLVEVRSRGWVGGWAGGIGKTEL